MSSTDRTTTIPPLYKVLKSGRSCHGGALQWPLPRADQPGDWVEVAGELVQCKVGLHLTNDPRHCWFDGNELYLVEIDTTTDFLPAEDDSDEWVARRVRLVRRIVGDELVALLRTLQPLSPIPSPLYAILYDCSGSGAYWSPPKKGQPGDWVEWKREDGSTELLTSGDGLHLITNPKSAWRAGCEVYEVETQGDVWVDQYKGIRAGKVRLLRRLPPSEMDKLGIGVEQEYRRSRSWGGRSNANIRKRDPKGMSPGEKFVRIMAEHGGVCCEKKGDAHDKENLDAALRLAITAGLEFKKGDVFKDAPYINNLYPLAIKVGNISACEAIESAMGRRPWMWLGKRLHDRSLFFWRNEDVRITSFDDEDDRIIACAYVDKLVSSNFAGHEEERTTEQISKRFDISHAEFDMVARKLKAMQTAEERLKVMVENFSRCKHVVNIMSLWHWTEAQLVEAQDWLRERADAVNKRKVNVVADPLPEFVLRAIEHEETDRSARQPILQKCSEDIGPQPNYNDFGDQYKWRGAVKVWEAKRAAVLFPLLHSRGTIVGALQRAFDQWRLQNFEGSPADYVEKVSGKGEGKRKGSRRATK